ncbi:ribonuclease HI family protein [Zoogloea sp.]|uniref:ribonuclease HI family protein n=1 Tax=Zoogloea sp. TaxID=49181 RepID=UPI001416D4B3|nr:MAG: ribonuclease HI family protein [Zoogloea sp.]
MPRPLPPPVWPDAWQLWFDGSASPNPGRIGMGALLLGPAGERIEVSELAPTGGCNNTAEVLALQRAVDAAHQAGARRVVIRGDSDFAVRHLLGSARTAITRLSALLEPLALSLQGFDEVRIEWVPRHRNGDADRLSRAALGLPDKPALAPLSRALSRRRRRR